MLKHSDLTRARIKLFLEQDLVPLATRQLDALSVEICEVPHPDLQAAKAGPWTPVDAGYEYGPAYTTFWFRLKGKAPQLGPTEVLALKASVGGERTLWRGNAPKTGIDWAHESVLLGEAAGDGTFYVQVYTDNPQCRVHLKELPREPKVAKVQGAWFVAVDPELKDLQYDVDFCLNLVEAVDEGDPAFATILRALNDVCNLFRASERETIARCRKLLREALSSLGGELKHQLVPVGHAHLDTAWLWPIHITKKKMAHTTATQLELAERYPEYVFVHSQASQYEWLEKEYPELFERVKRAIKRGQWEPVGSMWVEADCNLTGGESLVRQFLYGRKYFRDKFGVETKDMWLPDVFGYSAALPQILAKSNIHYFLTQKISWNDTNKFPHNTFWWQGIDGTRVWTHFPPADTYIGSGEPKEILRAVKNHRDKGRSDASLYVFGWGDGGGGPTERHIELLRRGRTAPNFPEVASGKSALNFFKDAKAKSKDLMTWVGELYAEFHRGTYTSQAATKKNNRLSEFLLRDAEWLACFVEDFPKHYNAAELERLWKLVLLNQFHDIIPGSSVREVYEDADKDYAEVLTKGAELVEKSLRSIAEKLDTEGKAQPVALFHNSAIPSQGEIPWTAEEAPNSLITADESVPVQLVEEFGERKIIFPTPHAALRSVCVGDLSSQPATSRSRLKASPRRIENHELSVKFDAHGNITSIQSLEDNTEFIEPGKLANLFQILEDKPKFWSAWDVDIYAFETAQDLVKSESFEIVEKGPVRVAAEIVKRVGKSTIRQRISLGPTPGVRFDTEIDWHEEDRMLKVAFPVNVHSPRATCEIQFGSVDRPTHVNTSWDQARFEICAQKWIDLSEGDQGVSLLNVGKYGHDVRGNVMRLSLLRSPKAPDPMCDMGVHRFTYVLMPHFGPHQYAGVVPAAYAVNAPVRHAFLEPKAGLPGLLPPLLVCDDRNIVVETVKKAEVGNNIVVRLYECHNSRGVAELHCLRTPKEAYLCDLEENPIAELEIQDGLVVVPYRPFEIITIKLVE
ncbi:MAG: alpha-mannosidase [Armatimonadetes bacterium]|nr:alpha-mannosidase [Armatimonadota bacterium]